MGIPDLQRLRQVGEQRTEAVFDPQGALCRYSRFVPGLDFAAEIMREQLQAVTDAQHGNAELENVRVRQRRVFGIHTGRAAGQDHAFGRERGDFRGGRVVAQDHGVDVALADAARDDLRVLRPEIQNDDLFGHGS